MSKKNSFLEKSNRKSINRFRVWLEQARYDLEISQVSFDHSYYEWSCYQSIQSVEKIIKAVIVHSGYRPPRIHKLGILLSIANQANKSFENIKLNFRKIEAYTFISRYPFIVPGQNQTPHETLSRHDAELCLRIATDILIQVEDFIAGQKLIGDEGTEIEMSDYYFTTEEVNKRIAEVVSLSKESKDIEIKKIILFGSFARELEKPRTTTMDILIVGETSLSFFERIQYIRELSKGGNPIIEPVIYTTEEFNTMLIDEGEGYLESAVEEGRVLFETE